MTLECSAILFDLDGVLIDSTACVERHWRQWAARHNLNADPILRSAHGVRNVDTMRQIAPWLDAEVEAAQFAAGEVADTDGVVAAEGAEQLLADLAGSPWAIVTSCSAALADARLAKAGLALPPVLITGSDVLMGKPEPEPYLLAAARLRIGPDDCIVVEDAPAGTEAGKRAGMRVIGVEFTYPRQDLVDKGADVVVRRLTEVRAHRSDDRRQIIVLEISTPRE